MSNRNDPTPRGQTPREVTRAERWGRDDDDALRRSEQRRLIAVEAADVGDYVLDLRTGHFEWGERALAMMRLGADASPSLEEHLEQIHPDDRGAVKDAIDRATDPDGDGRFHSEFRFLFADGDVRWIDSRGRAGFDEPGERATHLCGAMVDVTDRRRTEERLREAEDRSAFLLTLSDAIRPVEDRIEIQQVAMRLLGERLGATRAFYFLTEPEEGGGWTHIIETDYRRDPGMSSVAGRHSVGDFGIGLFEGAERGEVVAVEDVRRVPLLTPPEVQKYLAIDVVAFINVPLIKDGRFVAGIGAHDRVPRPWKEAEVALIAEVAERIRAAVERARAEAVLRESVAKLEAELADTRQLHRVCSSLIQGDDVASLYDLILEAARSLMRSDAASIQRLVPERRELFLFAQHGFKPESAEFWEWVGADDTTACGVAFALAEPVFVPDVERWDLVAGTEVLRHYRLNGLRAMLSTPLVSRDGRLVGVLSTHWRQVHQPSEKELRLLGVLARQAADLLERSAAEEALRKSEGRLRLALAAARMGIWTLDLSTGTHTRDANLNRLLGLEADETTRPFEDFLAHIHPDDRRPVREAFAASSREGRPLNVEFRVVRPDGSVRWLRDQGDVFGDAASGSRRMAGACVDVTDLKESESALRASEERLRGAFSIGTVGVMFWDESYRLTDVNDAFLRMTGFARDEVIGKPWQELMPPEPQAHSASAVEELRSRGEFAPFERQYLRRDGSRWWGLFAARRVGAEVVEFVLDVTRRKEAEEALKASEERLRRIVSSATDYAILTLDPGRTVTSWSPGAEAAFGYPEAEILGRSGDIIFTPEDRLAGEPEAEAGTALREGRAADERWHLRRDGTLFFASGVMTPLGPGGSLGFVKVLRDLTERKRVEDELRAAHDELELRVAERTAELEAEMSRRHDLARRLATAQEDERRRVSRDLHDSVGQLLAGLGMAFKAVETSASLPPSAAARLAEAEGIIEALGKEVHGLAVRLRPTSLDDIGLESALGQLVAEWSSRTGVRAHFHCTGLGPGRLTPEIETAVYRVVQEALTNVGKHARATLVSVILSRPGGHVSAVIEDNGAGFDPGAASRGRLGLVGMRERAGLVGGELEVESGPGSGTTLYVRIPTPGARGGTP